MKRCARKIRIVSRQLPPRGHRSFIDTPFRGAPRISATLAIAFNALALWALASNSLPPPPAPPMMESIAVTLLETPPPEPSKPEEPIVVPQPEAVGLEQPEIAPPPTQEPVKILTEESPVVVPMPMVVADVHPEPARSVPVAETVQLAGPAPVSAYWLSVRTAVAETVQYPAGQAIDTNILVRVERTESGFVVAAPAAGSDPFARSVREAAEQVAQRFAPPPREESSSAEWMVRFVK